MSRAVFRLREDGHPDEGICINGISLIVVAVPVRVEQISDRLVRPLANLCDVFTRARRQITRVHDKDAGVADDHDGIALRKVIGRIRVPNFVDSVGKCGDGPCAGSHRVGDGAAGKRARAGEAGRRTE